jgi:hypothetical protein
MTLPRKWTVLFAIAFSGLIGLNSLHAASPVGRWRGSWTSQSTGHRGPLKAHIRQLDHDSYRALFVGRFFVVIPFAYPARLDRVPGTCNQYTSTQQLPLVGKYRMNAWITSHHFHAHFQSEEDSGTFQMSR